MTVHGILITLMCSLFLIAIGWHWRDERDAYGLVGVMLFCMVWAIGVTFMLDI